MLPPATRSRSSIGWRSVRTAPPCIMYTMRGMLLGATAGRGLSPRCSIWPALSSGNANGRVSSPRRKRGGSGRVRRFFRLTEPLVSAEHGGASAQDTDGAPPDRNALPQRPTATPYRNALPQRPQVRDAGSAETLRVVATFQ